MSSKVELASFDPPAKTPEKAYEVLGVFEPAEPSRHPVLEARRSDLVGVKQKVQTGFDVVAGCVRILPLDVLNGLSTAEASKEAVDYWYGHTAKGELAVLYGINSGKLELNEQNAAAPKTG